MGSDLRDLLDSGVRGLRRLLGGEPEADRTAPSRGPAADAGSAAPVRGPVAGAGGAAPNSGPVADTLGGTAVAAERPSPVARDAARLESDSVRGVLFLSHTDPAVSVSGVDRYLHGEFAWLAARNRRYSVFSPEQGALPRRYTRRDGGAVRAEGARAERLLPAVDTAADAAGIEAVVVHHLFGYEPAFARALLERVRDRPILFHLNDIYLLNLTRLADDFAWLPAQFGWTPDAFAAVAEEMEGVVSDWLRAARMIVAPSQDLAARLAPRLDAYGIGSDRVRVEELLEFSSYRPCEPVRHARPRLAFFGHAMETKGWAVWQRLCADAGVRAAFDLFHIGADRDGDVDGVQGVAYTIGDGNPYAPVAALHDHEIDLALLWSTVPESSSYTMWEAHAAAVPVLTGTASGNIAASVGAGAVAGRVFEAEDELLRFLQDEGAVQALVAARQGKSLLRMDHRSALPLILGETATAAAGAEAGAEADA